jgi:hypothetical protein
MLPISTDSPRASSSGSVIVTVGMESVLKALEGEATPARQDSQASGAAVHKAISAVQHHDGVHPLRI